MCQHRHIDCVWLYWLSRLHGPVSLLVYRERGEAVFHAEVTKQISLFGFFWFVLVWFGSGLSSWRLSVTGVCSRQRSRANVGSLTLCFLILYGVFLMNENLREI